MAKAVTRAVDQSERPACNRLEFAGCSQYLTCTLTCLQAMADVGMADAVVQNQVQDQDEPINAPAVRRFLRAGRAGRLSSQERAVVTVVESVMQSHQLQNDNTRLRQEVNRLQNDNAVLQDSMIDTMRERDQYGSNLVKCRQELANMEAQVSWMCLGQ